ncbi:MAG: FAD:protein FMN transferase [Nitrosomonadales bacterium]|nr:FAD:protein FMN transferase [Nitrosomonadales bacterium]
MIFHRFSFKAMACDNELQFYAADSDAARRAANRAIAEVRRIETKYSRYREDSLVSQINREAGQSHVTVDEETAALLRFADTCYRDSGGRFDITSGVLRRIWDFRSGAVPGEQAVADILPQIGWAKVEWDGKQIRLPQQGMEIDFGGIGKEYAADRAALILRAEGISAGLVNLGGDICILGPHPDGSPWAVHIVRPRRPDTIMTTLPLGRGALTTSGDYQRYFESGGKRYCHILDPRTGWPVAYWRSATVIAAQCSAAGSAATIAMLLGGEAVAFLESRKLGYLLVDQQGKVTTNIAPQQRNPSRDKSIAR